MIERERERKNGKARKRRTPLRISKLPFALMALSLPLVLPFSCSTKEKVPEPYRPTHAHDAYRHSLETAGLLETALGRDWVEVSKSVLDSPADVELPISETFDMDPAAAFASAYRFAVMRGQRVEVEAEVRGEKTGRLFVDLFRAAEPSGGQGVLVASAGEGEARLEFEPRRDATYIVRFQPELLRGGRTTVTIRKAASLEFPVAGKDIRAIQSGFGAPRDAGRRVHHGVDIFARRHTDVLAPSDAVVHYVGDGGIGGNTIWLYDAKRSLYLYFAHLQTQDVSPYASVQGGQKIGTVGNTGNARTTPPHLHFGIYMRPEGPVDPVEFIRNIDAAPEPLAADLEILGSWVRTATDRISLRATNNRRSTALVFMDAGFPVRILGASGRQYRVALPDGTSGYVAAGSLESAAAPLESQWALAPQAVRRSPFSPEGVLDSLDAGEEFFVLGRSAEAWLVQTLQGTRGWISAPQGVDENPSPSTGSKF